MGVSIDFKELSSYQSSITLMRKEYHEFLKDFLTEMAERVISRTKPRTPVDTGALRASWELGDIHGDGENISIEILNGQEYATEIEYGHRIVINGVEIGWYEGRFMLKTSMDEIHKQIPLRYKSKFKEFRAKYGLV